MLRHLLWNFGFRRSYRVVALCTSLSGKYRVQHFPSSVGLRSWWIRTTFDRCLVQEFRISNHIQNDDLWLDFNRDIFWVITVRFASWFYLLNICSEYIPALQCVYWQWTESFYPILSYWSSSNTYLSFGFTNLLMYLCFSELNSVFL